MVLLYTLRTQWMTWSSPFGLNVFLYDFNRIVWYNRKYHTCATIMLTSFKLCVMSYKLKTDTWSAFPLRKSIVKCEVFWGFLYKGKQVELGGPRDHSTWRLTCRLWLIEICQVYVQREVFPSCKTVVVTRTVHTHGRFGVIYENNTSGGIDI